MNSLLSSYQTEQSYEKAAATAEKYINSETLNPAELKSARITLAEIHSAHGLSLKAQSKHREAIPLLEIATKSPEYLEHRKDDCLRTSKALASSQTAANMHAEASETYQMILDSGMLEGKEHSAAVTELISYQSQYKLPMKLGAMSVAAARDTRAQSPLASPMPQPTPTRSRFQSILKKITPRCIERRKSR